ncbi:ester cyclase [Kitasatospora cineracea]|uniref:ester cyclase n=1 Tax=Kitasatospora TaxID=2063 RepID=UPI0004C3A678|nr:MULTISPECIES: ester cyclase family protein [unclassified Kitasatospora]WAL73583.1 ester cyclase family protein [Kitasatospora sp. YST-16]WNW39640.1 ester cyclase family protein [Streptomyces sp. Li-HN-5-13]
MADQQDNLDLYRRFLDALNRNDPDGIAAVIDPAFRDHHPGFDISSLESYQQALKAAHDALDLRGELQEAFTAGDRVVTRVKLTGTHRGELLGIPATGRPVEWTTTEIWRAEDGLLAERWAQDDLLGLKEQLARGAENTAVVQRVSDAVNAHRYDDLDELFGPEFRDNNPAWSVTSLEELKGIIIGAHRALDFHAHLDALYPADPDKVIMHITFTGRHVGPFFGIEPTGKEVSWTSLEVYRLEHGKVVERWVQADTAGLMAQLGVELP